MNPSPKFRVGGVPEHFNLPWHLAIESGAFVDQGLNVEFRDVHGGTGAMTQQLNVGELDLAILLTEGAVADILKGNDNRLVKVYASSPLIWGIHVAAGNDAIQTVEQIQGKRFAISRYGSGSHLMALVDAAERGWLTEDMKFVVVNNLQGGRDALANGDADVFLWERFMTKPLVDSGEFRHVGDRVVPWPSFVASVRQEVLDTDAQKVKQVLSVAQLYAERLKTNEDAVRIIAARYGLQESDTAQWFEHVQWCGDFDCPEIELKGVFEYLNKLNVVTANGRGADEVWFKL